MADIATGVDGVTSIPATRTLTSASASFVTAGVAVGDILHIEDVSTPGDNDRYRISNVTPTVLTVSSNWLTGSLTGLTYRVQTTRQQFSNNAIDYEYIKRQDRDAFWHLYTPRRWWVLNQLAASERNIYGEPTVLPTLSIADGSTSVPSTRVLTSGTNLETAGIRALAELIIEDTGTSGDNGSYEVVSVAGGSVTVSRDWPVGSLTGLSCRFRMVYHKYTPHAVLVPFYLRMEIPDGKLDKYGATVERLAVLEMSRAVCEEIGITPKIGDRFDVDESDGAIQQFLVTDIDLVPISADFQKHHHIRCTAEKAQYIVR